MEANKETPPPIIDQLKEYAETRIKLAKYQAIEGSTSFVAGIITEFLVVFCLFLAFLFASITLGFFLAQVFHSYCMGFGCVAIMYLIIAFIMSFYKKKLEKPIMNVFVKKIIK